MMLRQGEDVHEWTDFKGILYRCLPDGLIRWLPVTQQWAESKCPPAVRAELLRLSAIEQAAIVYEGTREPEDFERLQRLLIEGQERR